MVTEGETAIELIDTLEADDSSTDPEHMAGWEEAKRQVPPRVRQLSPREREVAVLLYVKNLTLREIGEVLQVSESRVSQIHSQLKRRIRERLTQDSPLFSEVAQAEVQGLALAKGGGSRPGGSAAGGASPPDRITPFCARSITCSRAAATRSHFLAQRRARHRGDADLLAHTGGHGAVRSRRSTSSRAAAHLRPRRVARPVVEAWYGQTIDKPLRETERRDSARDLRERRRGGSSSLPSTSWVRARPDLPIYLAGLSPGMLRLAGEIADGVVLWLCNPAYVREVVVPTVTEGREGRQAARGLRHRGAAVRDDGRNVAGASPTSPPSAFRLRPGRGGPHSDGCLLAAVGSAEDAAATVRRYSEAGASSPCLGAIPVTDFDITLERRCQTLEPTELSASISAAGPAATSTAAASPFTPMWWSHCGSAPTSPAPRCSVRSPPPVSGPRSGPAGRALVSSPCAPPP